VKVARLHQLAGLAGVAPDETPQARLWGRRFEWPLVIVALWVPVQWYLEEVGDLPRVVFHIGNWVVWSFFVLETLVLTRLVRRKGEHLLHNWMNLAIIVFGLPVVWNYAALVGVLRSLRLLLILGLFMRVSQFWHSVLTRNQLGATLVVAFAVVMAAGALIARVDPNIHSPWDGVWWAWVTVTTVGYGDVVPTSPAGRLLGSLLILLGVGLFSLLTANISAFIIGRDAAKDEAEFRNRLKDVQTRLERIEALLEDRNQRDPVDE